MKELKTIILMIISLIILPACDKDNDEPIIDQSINIELTSGERGVINSINELSFDIMKSIEIISNDGNANYIICPYALACHIATTTYNSNVDKDITKEVSKLLHLFNNSSLHDIKSSFLKLTDAITLQDKSAIIKFASAFIQKDSSNFIYDFLSPLSSFPNMVDFSEKSSIQDISSWFYDQTGNKINNSINKIDEYDFCVLNSFSFKGIWPNKFDQTIISDFTNADGTKSKVQTLFGKKDFNVYFDEYFILNKAYFNNECLAITFIIPTKEYTLANVISKLNGYLWRNIVDNLGNISYYFRMPVLNYESEFNFSEIMDVMGFYNIIPSENIKSNRNHTFYNQYSSISIDENGTADPPEVYPTGSKDFNIDGPFLYIITEESTGAIMFVGKVSQL